MDFFTSSTDTPFCKNNFAVSLSPENLFRHFLLVIFITCVIATVLSGDSLK